MNRPDSMGAGIARLRSLPALQLPPATEAAVMLDHMRSSMTRGLPQVRTCRPHSHKMSVLAGGPSLADTYSRADGYLAAVNGSLAWLLDRGVEPNACGVLDPGNHMTDIVAARPGVNYFVASICHPSLFDKLIRAGCHVVLWHPSGDPQCEALLQRHDPNWFMIGGGCSMGLRWFNLGYVCGFRSFAMHGLDSSFRDGATHAYPDRADEKESITIAGRQTRLNFIAQVQDFFAILNRFGQNDMEATSMEIFGDGLLQDAIDHRLRERGQLFGVRATVQRDAGAGGGAQSQLCS